MLDDSHVSLNCSRNTAKHRAIFRQLCSNTGWRQILNYQTYLFFEGRTEYVQGYDTPQHTYPLGSLVFGVLDLDTAPYLERGRTLLEKFRGVEFSEDQTMQQSLAAPDTCVYYHVASFYHDFSTAVRQVSPALFDLVEGYTLANFRRNERELKATQHSLWRFIQTKKN